MKNLLNKLLNGASLNEEEAKELMQAIANGSMNDVQITAAITALIMRPLTYTEINAFRDVLLNDAVKIELESENAIDLCGTGGDGKNTFNISTLASFIVAAAGYKVIKHGNYGVSSGCGSSTVLEFLGYQFTTDQNILQKQLDEQNICFLHAPLFHPALKNVGQIRKDLGIRSFFNYLGPLLNPAQPAFQLVGVYNQHVMRLYNEVLMDKRTNFKVVHSLSGYDEICLTGSFKISNKGVVQQFHPSELGMNIFDESEIEGGETVKESSKIFIQILEGNGTRAQKEVVLANAAMAINCLNPTDKFQESLKEAELALNSGKALETFNHLMSKEYENA